MKFFKKKMQLLFLLMLAASLFVGAEPPPGGSQFIRTPAEWEPVKYVVIQWIYSDGNGEYSSVRKLMVQKILEAGAIPLLTVPDADDRTAILSYLADLDGVENIQFYVPEVGGYYGSPWPRDWFGQTVFYRDGSTIKDGMVNWNVCTGSSTGQDVPENIADMLNIPFFFNDVFKEDGGNRCVDGFGKNLFYDLMYSENGEAGGETYVKQTMLDYMGISDYLDVPSVAGYSDHMDLSMKMLDEETILYSLPIVDGDALWAPIQQAKYDAMSENIDWIRKNVKNTYGRPYRFVRTDARYPWGPCMYVYTNALFVNNVFLMPHYSDCLQESQAAYDSVSKYLPGYEVVPVLSDQLMVNGNGAGVHCATKEITEEKVIRIHHPRFLCPYKVGSTVTFKIGTWSVDPILSSNMVKVWIAPPNNPGNFVEYSTQSVGENQYSMNFTCTMEGEYRYYIRVVSNAGTEGFKPANGGQGGYYTLESRNDFIQVREVTSNSRLAKWDDNKTSFLKCSDIVASASIGNYQFRIRNSQYKGCGFSTNSGFGITGSEYEENDNMQGESLVNGFVFKKDGEPVFYISPDGNVKYATRVYTGMTDL